MIQQSFTYDGLNRLTSAARSDGGYNHNYNYDSFGNLLIQDNINPGPSYSINPATNQLNRYANGNNAYTYDAAGNLVSSGTSDIGGHTFAYNASSQIVSVDGGATATYLYNGLDERMEKDTPSGWTDYIYLNGQPMAELTSASLWTDYIYANGQKIARIADPYGAPTTVSYYLDDHLGTTQVELDSSGNITWQGQFTPFGSELADGSTAMHYKFTGKERDAESGLDYFGARYYGSSMGRWMSPDWSAKEEPVPYAKLDNPQSLNLYGYVGNNPLSRADADGHCFPWCLALAGGGALEAETPLVALGPVGWGVIGVTALGVGGYALYEHYHQAAPAAPSTPAPAQEATPVPTGLVGTDPKPTKGRTNSGPLAPENGGTGDAGKDFGTLTGGKSGPAPPGSTLPPGTQVGENGTQLRPGTPTSGPRIDIPANGTKPIETLHYPAPPPPPPPPPTPVKP